MRFPIRYLVGAAAAASLVLSALLAGHQMTGTAGQGAVLSASVRGPAVALASSSLSSEQAALGAVQQSVSNVASQAQAHQLQQLVKDEQFAAAVSRSTTTTTTSAPAPRSTVTALPTTGGAGGRAVAAAEAEVGKPYEYAGAGPNDFDCSGLTMYAWGIAGVSLPHSAQDQYDQIEHISTSDLQPGDLLFYGDSTSDIYHVAMYVSPGQMIEAENYGIPVGIHPIRDSGLIAEGRP